MSCSICSVVTAFADFEGAEADASVVGEISFELVAGCCPSAVNTNNDPIRAADKAEIRVVTDRISPAKAFGPLKYREMITPIGVNCDENSCF